MKIKLKHFSFVIVIFLTLSALNAQSNMQANGLSRGEALFKENNAKDAVQVLEYEILNGQVSDNTYNFLGLGYYQLEEYEKSLDAFKRGLKAQPENAKLLSYNMGNTYYAMKNYSAAAEAYSDALKAEPLFYDALLNRANALLMKGQLLSAKEDYVDFVAKCPDDPQRERIELLIKALEEEIARREEEARLLAEQNKAKWEEYDGSLDERKKEAFSPYWEKVDAVLADEKKPEDAAEWERIHGEDPGAVIDAKDSNESEKVSSDEENGDSDRTQWEKFEGETENIFVEKDSLEEEVDESEEWLTFSEEELIEMKALEEESRSEREKWLEDVRRREAEAAEKNARIRQREEAQALEGEKRMREQLLEDMRKAEEERRKKLLEDVANSLQGTDSTNLTSGAEDLIDYDLEGELD